MGARGRILSVPRQGSICPICHPHISTYSCSYTALWPRMQTPQIPLLNVSETACLCVSRWDISLSLTSEISQKALEIILRLLEKAMAE